MKRLRPAKAGRIIVIAAPKGAAVPPAGIFRNRRSRGYFLPNTLLGTHCISLPDGAQRIIRQDVFRRLK